MTVRVAIESLYVSLAEKSLGNDELGISIAKNYLKYIERIRSYYVDNEKD